MRSRELHVESAVLNLLKDSPDGFVPWDLLKELQTLGFTKDQIRYAMSDLWDRGKIELCSDGMLRRHTEIDKDK